MSEESVNPAAQEYYCRLTNAGAALEAAAHAAAKPVVLTHVAVGDGNGEVPTPAASATALVNEVYRRQIDGRERDKEDPNIAWLHIIIPADVGGFWIREFGIYAAPLEEGGEPVLYAYGNHAPYYKQQTAQGQATTHELSIPIILSGTAEVEISVKDAGYATALAFEDLRDTVMGDRERLWENDGEGPQVLGGVLPLATADAPGLVQPDGRTTQVDEGGLLSALGGNLLLNSEEWITESGEWIAPLSGWYDILAIDGGEGGLLNLAGNAGVSGRSGAYKRATAYFTEGQSINITIGAGGLTTTDSSREGGNTAVGDIDFAQWANCSLPGQYIYRTTTMNAMALGGGFGGRRGDQPGYAPLMWFGAGGGAYLYRGESNTIPSPSYAYEGKQGVVLMRWHDPDKTAGPAPAPALFSARRMASRAVAEPVVVNLYDPATGQGSVWREEDAEAKMAEGLIGEAAWLEICAARAAEERAAWLADPETCAERFEMLRMACEAKLAETDKLVQPDYPISDESRAALLTYRKDIRELNHQPGAPWDGGGELTPWPEEPAVTKVQEA